VWWARTHRRRLGESAGPFGAGKKGEGLAERGKILHYLRVPPPAPKNGIGAFAPVPFSSCGGREPTGAGWEKVRALLEREKGGGTRGTREDTALPSSPTTGTKKRDRRFCAGSIFSFCR
jgi:hypothetical protein